MRLTESDARARLLAQHHGVLATRHPSRGVDVVPVVYAVDGAWRVGIPVDRVKAKASGPLQRERNLAADPRATLLVEHWDPVDWSRLWWVRAELRSSGPDHEGGERLAGLLAAAYPQYRDRPFDRIIVLDVHSVTGWAAGPG